MKNRSGRTQRLYIADNLAGRCVRLDHRQAHYLRHVLRLKGGETVILFDGRGKERLASIARLTGDAAELRVLADAEPIPESSLNLNLIQALVKADAMDLIVQKATELGVVPVAPVRTEFSVVRLDAGRMQRRLEHWRRIAQSACEQSGRHRPALIREPMPLADMLAQLPENVFGAALHAGSGRPLASASAAITPGRTIYLLVGPEGGLSEQDLHAAERAGFERYSLGPRTLRTETACVAGCALAQALWGDLGV
jgi:16S rRNA (uracil1498-N3)-methyltransferase